MYEIFADLHVHIGRSETGKPVKITGARTNKIHEKIRLPRKTPKASMAEY